MIPLLHSALKSGRTQNLLQFGFGKAQIGKREGQGVRICGTQSSAAGIEI